MSYISSHLNAGESIVVETRRHWLVFGWLIIALAGFAPILFGSDSSGSGGRIFLWTVIILMGLYTYAVFASSEFAVTTQRVVVKTGILNRRTVEIQLAKLEAVSMEQSVLGSALDYGTLVVSGTGGTKEKFSYIRGMEEFRRAAQERSSSLATPEAVRAERECPFCAERILAKASVCRFCGKPVTPAEG